MPTHSWSEGVARERIATRLAEVEDVEIRDYVRDTDLTGIGTGVAYRVDGVHLYVDILNIDELLAAGSDEETGQRQALQFLNLHYRAVSRILDGVDAIRVDFHNQRLHAVVAKPYGDEKARVRRAIAIAQLIVDVVALVNASPRNHLPAAKVRVGIDSGLALAVNNGRRGEREPLFLGSPANLAAKRAGGGDAVGLFATNNARLAAGFAAIADEDATCLTLSEIGGAEDDADLEVTPGRMFKQWETDLDDAPVEKISFSGHTPPFSSLEFSLLSLASSRRQDAVSIHADIDGFTNYVATNVATEAGAKNVVRALHALRSEMDAVIKRDFEGRKIRFIGDCMLISAEN